MKPVFRTVMAAVAVSAMALSALANHHTATAAINKGIASLGGAEMINKAQGFQMDYEDTRQFQGNEAVWHGFQVTRGIDHRTVETEGEGPQGDFFFINTIAGDKGWFLFGDNSNEMQGDQLANQKRQLYLDVAPMLLTPLLTDQFKIADDIEEEVDGKMSVKIKVTGPDGKDFALWLDKETGLPVKLVATVMGFQGNERTLEVHYADYKEFDGFKVATSVNAPGEGFGAYKRKVTSFKLLDEVSDERFSEP